MFKVWTDPAHIGQWWGPRGFTTTTYAMDVRPGGVWRFCMHGPDGVDYQNEITYLEVVEPERIVYEHGGDEDCEPVNFQVTATFEDHGGKTKLTMRRRSSRRPRATARPTGSSAYKKKKIANCRQRPTARASRLYVVHGGASGNLALSLRSIPRCPGLYSG